MKKLQQRDLIPVGAFVGAVLGVTVVALGLAIAISYLFRGSPPSDGLARETYAEGVKALFTGLCFIGIAIVSLVYPWQLGRLVVKQRTIRGPGQAQAASVARRKPEGHGSACLPPRVGWGILLGFVLLMVIVSVAAAV
jgi:hypothetical protein